MWKTVKISDVCEFQSGLWKGKKTPFTKANVIRNTNFRPDGNLSYKNIALLEVETKELSKRQLHHGDIILEKSGGGEKTPVGRVCLFEKKNDKTPFSLSNFTCFIRVKEPSILDYKFLHKFLNYMYASGKTETMQRNSTGIRNLQLKEYKDVFIPIPPLAEQKLIVTKLDAAFTELDKTINIAQETIKNTNLLFEKKIKQYFIDNITNAPFVKLSDISEYFNGLTYSPKDVSDKGIIVLRSGNIQNGKMEYSDIKRVNKEIKDKLYLKPTDLLICSRNGSQRLIGKSSLIGEMKEPMTFGTFMMIVRSEHNHYLQWFIKSKLFKKQILKGENTMINQITRYMLDDISLPFPNKKIYSKIVDELEKLDGHIRMMNKILDMKIDNLNKLKLSILKQELDKAA
ncbi:restriction endonuclease subunit S [Candidatus Pelagibacter sp.]|nr:restriction endonuclease subunit S [Candidatus Pelagibacter sp.]